MTADDFEQFVDDPKVTRMQAVEYTANGWLEGFLHGALFESGNRGVG